MIFLGNTLYIKLSEDSRNVGRKQNYIIITFCLLNEGDEVLKPNYQFRYILYLLINKLKIYLFYFILFNN